MSKLFEQLQKAAVARAQMAPQPVVPPQAAADLEAARAAAERAAAEREGAEIEALRVAEVERLAAHKAFHLVEVERQAKEAEWARIAAEEAVRKAATVPPLREDRQPEPFGTRAQRPRALLAKGIAAIVILAIVALAWYFAPSPTPATEPARAQPPSSLKLDPKLDLARPR